MAIPDWQIDRSAADPLSRFEDAYRGDASCDERSGCRETREACANHDDIDLRGSSG